MGSEGDEKWLVREYEVSGTGIQGNVKWGLKGTKYVEWRESEVGGTWGYGMENEAIAEWGDWGMQGNVRW